MMVKNMTNEPDFSRLGQLMTGLSFELGRIRVVVVGCGGIGSPLSVLLSKMGITNVTFIDDDIVEAHNIPSQMFHPMAVGEKKVHECEQQFITYSPYEVEDLTTRAITKKTSDDDFEWPNANQFDILILGTDSILSRKQSFDALHEYCKCVIDVRLNGTHMEAIAFTMDDTKSYNNYLNSLEVVGINHCVQPAIFFMGMFSAGFVGDAILRYVTNRDSLGYLISFDTTIHEFVHKMDDFE